MITTYPVGNNDTTRWTVEFFKGRLIYDRLYVFNNENIIHILKVMKD